MDAVELQFAAPDKGLWTNDRVHFFRPETAIAAELRSHAFDGNQLPADRYAELIGRPDRISVHRFAYSRARPLVPRPEGDEATARVAWEVAVAVEPVASRRIATAERVFVDKIWRGDVVSWDEQRKPAAMGRTRALAAEHVSSFDDAELMTHLGACINHLAVTMSLHHEFNGTWRIPLRDYLARASGWTGLSPAVLMATLEGASPVSTGGVPELRVLASLIAEDEQARELLDTAEPAAALDELQRHDGPLGKAAQSYIQTVGYRLVSGFDTMDEYALEHPAGLVEALRRADPEEDVVVDGAEAIENARDKVPAAHRDEFNSLLTEARLTFRVKDERAVFANTPVAGLVRRAVLQIGERLSTRGLVATAEHAVEANPEELQELLTSTADNRLSKELSDRYLFRSSYTSNDAPPTLGSPHESPPPDEWLSEPARRVALAGAAAAAAMRSPEAETGEPFSDGALIGSGVSSGTYTGPARFVLNPGDIGRVQSGDVLVAIATNPGYSAVMNICGAIVTDAGGPLSHAAIVARELGVPAVVGTRTATTTIPDGATVTVDGAAGEVRIGG